MILPHVILLIGIDMENMLVGTVGFAMLNHLMKNWNTVNNQDLLTLMTVIMLTAILMNWKELVD